MKEFKIPFQESEFEFTEKRSRFIGHIWRISSEEEAMEHIREMKSRYYDARHNCWCYCVGETLQRYSDDGEPQGTAGQPMLKVFEHTGVTNVCCVVTRYFGGILLGTGGLTRAYSKSAKDTLSQAGVATVRNWNRFLLNCSYSMLDRYKIEFTSAEATIDEISYSDIISMEISVPENNSKNLLQTLNEIESGKLDYLPLEDSLHAGPREEV